MVKILKAPAINKKKRRISLRLPKEMLADVDKAILRKGGNKKQRSQFISKSIINLEHISSYPALITENWLDRGDNTAIQITLSSDADNALERIVAVAKEKLEINGELISPSIRTAILQWLLQNGD